MYNNLFMLVTNVCFWVSGMIKYAGGCPMYMSNGKTTKMWFFYIYIFVDHYSEAKKIKTLLN